MLVAECFSVCYLNLIVCALLFLFVHCVRFPCASSPCPWALLRGPRAVGVTGTSRGGRGFSCTARKLASWDSWGLGCVRGAYLRRSSLHCSASRLHDSALWFVTEIWICLVVVYRTYKYAACFNHLSRRNAEQHMHCSAVRTERRQKT